MIGVDPLLRYWTIQSCDSEDEPGELSMRFCVSWATGWSDYIVVIFRSPHYDILNVDRLVSDRVNNMDFVPML